MVQRATFDDSGRLINPQPQSDAVWKEARRREIREQLQSRFLTPKARASYEAALAELNA